MDVHTLRRAVQRRSGQEPMIYSDEALAPLAAALANADVAEYLRNCVVTESYGASDINMCTLKGIVDENLSEGGPGCFIYPFGYLVIGTSTGGNCVCLGVQRAGAFWADHSSFSEAVISHKDRSTGEWVYAYEYNADNVAHAMTTLSSNIESFFLELLGDRLTLQLEELD